MVSLLRRPPSSIPQMISNAIADPEFDNSPAEYVYSILHSSTIVPGSGKEASNHMASLLIGNRGPGLSTTQKRRAIELVSALVENSNAEFRLSFASPKLWSALADVAVGKHGEDDRTRRYVYRVASTWRKSPVPGVPELRLAPAPSSWIRREKPMSEKRAAAQDQHTDEQASPKTPSTNTTPIVARRPSMMGVAGITPEMLSPKSTPPSRTAVWLSKLTGSAPMPTLGSDIFATDSILNDGADTIVPIESVEAASLLECAGVLCDDFAVRLDTLPHDLRPSQDSPTIATYRRAKQTRRLICRVVYVGSSSQNQRQTSSASGQSDSGSGESTGQSTPTRKPKRASRKIQQKPSRGQMEGLLQLNDRLNELIVSYEALETNVREKSDDEEDADDGQRGSRYTTANGPDVLDEKAALPLESSPASVSSSGRRVVVVSTSSVSRRNKSEKTNPSPPSLSSSPRAVVQPSGQSTGSPNLTQPSSSTPLLSANTRSYRVTPGMVEIKPRNHFLSSPSISVSTITATGIVPPIPASALPPSSKLRRNSGYIATSTGISHETGNAAAESFAARLVETYTKSASVVGSDGLGRVKAGRTNMVGTFTTCTSANRPSGEKSDDGSKSSEVDDGENVGTDPFADPFGDEHAVEWVR